MNPPTHCLVCGKPLADWLLQSFCPDCSTRRHALCERLERDTDLQPALRTLARYGQPVPDTVQAAGAFTQQVVAHRMNPFLTMLVVAVKGNGLTMTHMGTLWVDVMLDAQALYDRRPRITDAYKKKGYNDMLRVTVGNMFETKLDFIGLLRFQRLRDEGYTYLWA